MTSKTYRVAATKSGKYWHLDIEDMPQGTQVRRLSEAKETAADLINIFTETHLGEIAIDLRIQLPDDETKGKLLAHLGDDLGTQKHPFHQSHQCKQEAQPCLFLSSAVFFYTKLTLYYSWTAVPSPPICIRIHADPLAGGRP